MTLVYLDNKLSQLKYLLARDITTQLIQDPGIFSISWHDRANREVIVSGMVLIPQEKGFVFNQALDNYELKWTLGTRQIRYRVNRTGDAARYVYTEAGTQYGSVLHKIEKACI